MRMVLSCVPFVLDTMFNLLLHCESGVLYRVILQLRPVTTLHLKKFLCMKDIPPFPKSLLPTPMRTTAPLPIIWIFTLTLYLLTLYAGRNLVWVGLSSYDLLVFAHHAAFFEDDISLVHSVLLIVAVQIPCLLS